MRLEWLCFTAFVILAGCDASVETRLTAARGAMDKGDYRVAMIEVKNALDSAPTNPRAQVLLAALNTRNGNYLAADKVLDDLAGKADAHELATLRVRNLFEQAKFDSLLALADSDTSLAYEERQLARAQALDGLGRCGEALPIARALTTRQPTLMGARLVSANCLLRQGDKQGALQVVSDGLQVSPQAADGWMARAKLQRMQGRNGEAEQSLASVLKFAPGQLSVPAQAEAHAELINILIDRGAIAEARAQHQELLTVIPQGPLTEMILARIYLQEGNPEAAQTTLQPLLQGKFGADSARVMMISALTAQRRIEQAIQQLELVRQTSPNSRSVTLVAAQLKAMAAGKPASEQYWLAAGAVQTVLNQLPLARTAFTEAQTAAPDSIWPRLALTQLDLRIGHLDEAMRRVEELQRAKPDDVQVLATVGQVQMARGKPAEAEAALALAWNREPSAAVAAALFSARAALKSPNQTDSLKNWLAKSPNDLNIRALYADVLRRQGADRAAIAEYEKLAVAGTSAPILNNLAWLYYRVHDPRALVTARRAWQLAPDSPEIGDTYGWLLVETGATQEGATILKKATERGGASIAVIQYHYAAAAARTGDKATARKVLEALLRDYAQFEGRADAERLHASLGVASGVGDKS